MSNDDQDALAAAWAAQLEEEEGGADDAAAPEAEATPEEAAPEMELPAEEADAGGSPSEEEMAAQWAASLEQDEHAAAQAVLQKKSLSSQASEAVFKNMTDIARRPTADGAKRELDFILDIPLDVSVELGRTRLLINELLQLGQGSVVELNKLAGEPLEVFVNGKLVARGEAVVINEKFGVRLTDIISPMERVKQLG